MRSAAQLVIGAWGLLVACQPPAPPPPAAPMRVPTSAPTLSEPGLPAPSPTVLTPSSPPPIKGALPPYPYPLPASPSVGPDELAGLVVERGAPAKGIPISVISARSSRTYKLTTDSQGVFRVAALPEGEYYAHFYNDSDNNKVGFWRTRTLPVTHRYGAVFPAWDVYLVGMRNVPGQGASVAFPFTAEFEPYPLAVTYRFRIHDRGGPGGSALYVSDAVPAKGVRRWTFNGAFNQNPGASGSIGSGRYLWGYQWDAGIAGEGGCLFQDFVSAGLRPTPLTSRSER